MLLTCPSCGIDVWDYSIRQAVDGFHVSPTFCDCGLLRINILGAQAFWEPAGVETTWSRSATVLVAGLGTGMPRAFVRLDDGTAWVRWTSRQDLVPLPEPGREALVNSILVQAIMEL